MRHTPSLLAAGSLLCLANSVLTAQGTRLLRSPALSRDNVAFAYGGDLWVVPRSGGSARRLTSTPSVEEEPNFSPDGSMIAFSATVGGNMDVYVVPTAGGEPKRLTYHPGADAVRGWTPDGKRVIFASGRTGAPTAYTRLWSIGLEDGLPEPLPMPRAWTGTYSPDTRHIAYEEFSRELTPGWALAHMSGWRHYRGGKTHPIQIMNVADHSVTKLPWTNSNDSDPMWIGETVYFLSDRDGTVNLYSWRSGAKSITQLTHHQDFDIMNASAGPDAIVYEQAGYVHLLDIKDGQDRQLAINATGDFPWTRPRLEAAGIRSAAIAPTGTKAAFEARGDIFVVPAERGETRDITQTSGVHNRNPTWSPDGTQLAWLSDAGGEYQLMVGEASMLTKPRAIPLPTSGYFTTRDWSPDGKLLLLDDNHLNLWTFDVASSHFTKIDTDLFDEIGRADDAVWSPDSRWLAYSKSLNSRMRAIYTFSLATGKASQITDGLSNAISPAFDAGGKYLYFLASTNFGPATNTLDMSSIDHPATYAVYLTVLAGNEPSPFLAELDDAGAGTVAQAGRAGGGGGGGARGAEAAQVRIDPDGIAPRTIALSIPAGDYRSLQAGPAGSFFYLAPAPAGGRGDRGGGGGGGTRVMRYQIRDRTAQPFLDAVTSYTVSADKRHVLYGEPGGGGGRAGRGGAAQARFAIATTDRAGRGGAAGDAAGGAELDLSGVRAWVDPKAEWSEIFRETWRIEREFFYDAKMHGADWNAVYEKYKPLLPFVQHRDDLGYLIAQVGGELTVGHSYLSGAGDEPTEDPVSIGLLGADVSSENGHYRIKKIYSGENWNPELQAPLAAPGIQVAEGDYILEVDGRPIAPPTNFYSAFQGLAGHNVVLRVSSSPSAAGGSTHLVTVTPIASEGAIRSRDWVEDNRRAVDKLSGGRLGYVWLPNTAAAGYQQFIRYYYAQQDKEGIVIDERYNGGGQIADFIVNELGRSPDGYFARRDGAPKTSPGTGIYGPKVMIINESAGSGGDALPYMFHLRKLGTLVGTRTWGGLVGTLTIPETLDGG
ncbi:MAG TPA: PDZ domain-containing protein, partial [Gemmatimonadaceae bacterium]|nr:PDZ domain-containing protein [Gemmatimonadaceae bacterium]